MKTIFLALAFASSPVLAAQNPVPPANPRQLELDTLSLGDQSTTCFNVSGTWKGTCEVRTAGTQDTQNIQQKDTEMTFTQTGCAMIQAAEFGQSYIGTVKNESISSSAGVRVQSASAKWVENGKKLTMNQAYTLIKYGDQGTLSKGNITGEFELKDNVLTGTITQKMSTRNMRGEAVSNLDTQSDCRLTRQ